MGLFILSKRSKDMRECKYWECAFGFEFGGALATSFVSLPGLVEFESSF